MAAARDQAAAYRSPGRDRAEPQAVREPPPARPTQRRVRRRGHAAADSSRRPARVDKPAAARRAAAPKSGKRQFVLMGVVALLALAARLWRELLSGRPLHRLHRRRLCPRQQHDARRAGAGHIAAIVPWRQCLVQAGDVIFRIDDGDYRIAVDAARAKIATQQATIDAHRPPGRARSRARSSRPRRNWRRPMPASKRAQLDFDRQQALSDRALRRAPCFEQSDADARPDRRLGAGRAGRLRRRARQCRSHQGAAEGGARPARRAARPRSTRPSAISTSPR